MINLNPKQNRFLRAAVYFVIAWLVGCLGVYFLNSPVVLTWQSVFILRNQPLACALLVILMAAVLAIPYMEKGPDTAPKRKQRSKKALPWLSTVGYDRNALLLSISLSCVFYALFGLAAKMFPTITGHRFENDWTLVFVSSMPAILFVTLVLLDRLRRLKIGDVEIELGKTITLADAQSLRLSQLSVQKGLDTELPQVIDAARLRQPQILTVPLEGTRFPVYFLTLRQYVFQLRKVAPIKYLVFVGTNRRYIAFMSIEKFCLAYPMSELEAVARELLDLAETDRAADLVPPHVVQRVIDESANKAKSAWKALSGNSANEVGGELTSSNILELGATTQRASSRSVLETYATMVEYDIPGLPVVDDRGTFLGIAEKTRVVDELVKQIMSKS